MVLWPMGNTWCCGAIPETTRSVVGCTWFVLVQVMLRLAVSSVFTLVLLCAGCAVAYGQHVVLLGDPQSDSRRVKCNDIPLMCAALGSHWGAQHTRVSSGYSRLCSVLHLLFLARPGCAALTHCIPG